VRWLEDRLAAWRRDPRIDFIVAFYHECAFSTCNGHSSDGGVRAKLAPLFHQYKVDLAVQGHNHVYGRTNPLIYDAKTQTGPYVSERDFSVFYETVDWSQARYDDYGFSALDVTPAKPGHRTTMTLRFINQQGTELDRVVFARTAGEVL
jgi:hypothetical protein